MVSQPTTLQRAPHLNKLFIHKRNLHVLKAGISILASSKSAMWLDSVEEDLKKIAITEREKKVKGSGSNGEQS
jgi:hypothetical protein